MILERLYCFEEISIDLYERVETILSKPEKTTEEIASAVVDYIDRIRSIRENAFIRIERGKGRN